MDGERKRKYSLPNSAASYDQVRENSQTVSSKHSTQISSFPGVTVSYDSMSANASKQTENTGIYELCSKNKCRPLETGPAVNPSEKENETATFSANISPATSVVEDVIVPRQVPTRNCRLLHDVMLLYPEHGCCDGRSNYRQKKRESPQHYDLTQVDSARKRIFDAHKQQRRPTLSHDFQHVAASEAGHDDIDGEPLTCSCSCCGIDSADGMDTCYDDEDDEYKSVCGRDEETCALCARPGHEDRVRRRESSRTETRNWVQNTHGGTRTPRASTVRTYTKSIPERHYYAHMHGRASPAYTQHDMNEQRKSYDKRSYYQDVFDAVIGKRVSKRNESRVPTITEWNEFYENAVHNINEDEDNVATSQDEDRSLSTSKLFNWIGRLIYSAAENINRKAGNRHHDTNATSESDDVRQHRRVNELSEYGNQNDFLPNDPYHPYINKNGDTRRSTGVPNRFSVDFRSGCDTIINSSIEEPVRGHRRSAPAKFNVENRPILTTSGDKRFSHNVEYDRTYRKTRYPKHIKPPHVQQMSNKYHRRSEENDTDVRHLQKKLADALRENERLKSQMLEQYSGEDSDLVRNLQNGMELERQKNSQLAAEMARIRTKLRSALFNTDSDLSFKATSVIEDEIVPRYSKDLESSPPGVSISTSSVVTLKDYDEESVYEEAFSIKRLKHNIRRFKVGMEKVMALVNKIRAIFLWKKPYFTLTIFLTYMVTVWFGLLLPLLVVVAAFRICASYFEDRGYGIHVTLLMADMDLPQFAALEGASFSTLGMIDKFQLILQVAQTAQNTLGEQADNMEKVKNLLLWKEVAATRFILKNLCILLALTIILKTSTFLRIAGLILGIKMFILDYLYYKFPKFKYRTDRLARLWRELPTDEDLKSEEPTDTLRVVDLRPSASHSASEDDLPSGSSEDTRIASTTFLEYPEEDPLQTYNVMEPARKHMLFCRVFAISAVEMPMNGWENGRKAINVDESHVHSDHPTGRLFLTNSYLCFLSVPTRSSSNKKIRLHDIEAMNHGKKYLCAYGNNPSIEIRTIDRSEPYIFAGISNADECFAAIYRYCYYKKVAFTQPEVSETASPGTPRPKAE